MPRFISSLLILMVLIFATPVSAQDETNQPAAEEQGTILTTITTGGQDPLSPLQCFDYYDFNSVEVTLQPSVEQTTAGTPITFSGSVTNQNDYPLTDVSLIVKVFKVDETLVQNGQGNQVVDYYTLEEGILLKANEERELRFDWNVPGFAEGGEYFIAIYALNAQFAMTGLTFSDDIYGNATYFTVLENDNEVAILDKNATFINDEPYRFVDFPPTINADASPVVIRTQLVNPTDEQMTVPLQWRQYSFDASREENHRNTDTQVVTLEPGESREVTYEVKADRAPVIFVTATTEDRGVKNILNIRYVQEGMTMPRLSHLGLSTFPINPNTEVAIVACAHTTGETIPNAKITLLLTDNNTGATVFQHQYEGDINSLVGGYGEKFFSENMFDNVTLKATLEQNGVVIETAEVVYDCHAIPGMTCHPSVFNQGNIFDRMLHNPWVLLGGSAILLVLLYLASVWRRKRVARDTSGITTFSVAISVLFGMGLLLSGGSVVEAKTVTVTGSVSDSTSGDYLHTDFIADYTVVYRATLYNQATGQMINDGDTVPPGTVVELRPGTRANAGARTSDVQYNFTGSVTGTPNGAWDAYYNPGDTIGHGMGRGCLPGIMGEHNYTVYTAFAVSKVAETFSLSGVTYDELSPGVYRVTSGGPVTASVTFPNTTGRWTVYHQARAGQNQCGGSQGVVSTNIAARTATFTFNVSGAPANNPPAAPSVTGPATGLANSNNVFTISGGSDPDGDQVRYGVTNAACTLVTRWLPDPGHFTPGSQTLNQGWTTAGTYTVYVLSEDVNGARSGCGSHTITISNPPPAIADLKVNNSDGPLTVGKNAPITLSWSHSNAGTCTIYGDGLPSGQLSNVAASGTHTIPGGTVAAGSETYAMTCTAPANDSVAVTITNQNPNAPTITGPTSSPGAENNTFAIQGTDPDNDQIFYEIDWNNDGLSDVTTPGVGFVPSGTSLDASRSWLVAGTYIIQARTVDIDNARSAWTQHTITITSSVPATATLEVRINSGGWSTSNPPPVDTNDTTTLRWSSTNATTCTGANFNTGNATSNGGLTVTTPAPGASTAFTLTCTGPGGTDSKTITVTAGLPNFNRPIATHSLSTTFNPATGDYDSVTISFQTTNDGISGTRSTAPYSLRLDSRSAVTGTIPLLTRNQASPNFSHTINTIPFGTHTATIVVDTNNSVTESNEGDNTYVYNFGGIIPPPDPGLDITADKIQLRNEETTTIRWRTTATYPTLACQVSGPGMNINPAALTGTQVTQPITAKSEYTFRCTETTTNTTWSDSVTVETQGVIEEI